MSDYQIIREVGKGGMGCVYEAISPSGERVALKMMSAKAASHPDYREMFEHEVQSLRRLSNPAIVRIVGEPFSDSSGNIYLPMEFVEGRTISQIVNDDGPYNEQDALQIFIKLLDAFSYIHSRSCIHRDVKPSNIMIRPDGSVCVIDFGIAKDSKTSTGKTIGRIVGTDGYMSPEQANGYNIDTRTDIYSLGCLLHYMLCGSHAIPKQSNDYETICAILENNFPLVSEKGISISDRTQKAILTAVNKNMTLRFQTAEEFKFALSGKNTYKVTVGRANCHINMPGEYVSGHHLDIIWEPQDNAGAKYKVTIRDHSTNGTGVNGRKLHNDAFSFTSENLPSLKGNNSSFPQVMIAGLPDYMLDWTAVAGVLFDIMDMPTSVINNDEWGQTDSGGEETHPAGKPDELSIGMAILCFIAPIVGWILGAVWKNEYPIKGEMATKLGWYGFLFNIVMFFLSTIISNAVS